MGQPLGQKMALLGVVLGQDGAFVGVLGQRMVGAALGWRMAVSVGVAGTEDSALAGRCWDRGWQLVGG